MVWYKKKILFAAVFSHASCVIRVRVYLDKRSDDDFREMGVLETSLVVHWLLLPWLPALKSLLTLLVRSQCWRNKFQGTPKSRPEVMDTSQCRPVCPRSHSNHKIRTNIPYIPGRKNKSHQFSLNFRAVLCFYWCEHLETLFVCPWRSSSAIAIAVITVEPAVQRFSR